MSIFCGAVCLLFGLFFAFGFGVENAKETGIIWPIFFSLFFTALGAAIFLESK